MSAENKKSRVLPDFLQKYATEPKATAPIPKKSKACPRSTPPLKPSEDIALDMPGMVTAESLEEFFAEETVGKTVLKYFRDWETYLSGSSSSENVQELQLAVQDPTKAVPALENVGDDASSYPSRARPSTGRKQALALLRQVWGVDIREDADYEILEFSGRVPPRVSALLEPTEKEPEVEKEQVEESTEEVDHESEEEEEEDFEEVAEKEKYVEEEAGKEKEEDFEEVEEKEESPKKECFEEVKEEEQSPKKKEEDFEEVEEKEEPSKKECFEEVKEEEQSPKKKEEYFEEVEEKEESPKKKETEDFEEAAPKRETVVGSLRSSEIASMDRWFASFDYSVELEEDLEGVGNHQKAVSLEGEDHRQKTVSLEGEDHHQKAAVLETDHHEKAVKGSLERLIRGGVGGRRWSGSKLDAFLGSQAQNLPKSVVVGMLRRSTCVWGGRGRMVWESEAGCAMREALGVSRVVGRVSEFVGAGWGKETAEKCVGDLERMELCVEAGMESEWAMVRTLASHGMVAERMALWTSRKMRSGTNGREEVAEVMEILVRRGLGVRNWSSGRMVAEEDWGVGMEILIRAGADVNAQSRKMETDCLLSLALQHSNWGAVRVLIEHGATVTDVAVCEAASKRDGHWTALVLRAGGNPDTPSQSTPALCRAAEAGAVQSVLALLEAGAIRGKEQALETAAHVGNAAVARALFCHDAPLSDKATEDLKFCAKRGHKEMAELLYARTGVEVSGKEPKPAWAQELVTRASTFKTSIEDISQYASNPRGDLEELRTMVCTGLPLKDALLAALRKSPFLSSIESNNYPDDSEYNPCVLDSYVALLISAGADVTPDHVSIAAENSLLPTLQRLLRLGVAPPPDTASKLATSCDHLDAGRKLHVLMQHGATIPSTGPLFVSACSHLATDMAHTIAELGVPLSSVRDALTAARVHLGYMSMSPNYFDCYTEQNNSTFAAKCEAQNALQLWIATVYQNRSAGITTIPPVPNDVMSLSTFSPDEIVSYLARGYY